MNIFALVKVQYLEYSVIRRSFYFQNKNTRTFPSKWYIAEKNIILLSLTGSTHWISPFYTEAQSLFIFLTVTYKVQYYWSQKQMKHSEALNMKG